MTQYSYSEAIKRLNKAEQYIMQLEKGIEAIAKEMRGAVLLNWVLVRRAGGSVEIPRKELEEVSAASKFRINDDPDMDTLVFTATVDMDELLAIDEAKRAAEVDAQIKLLTEGGAPDTENVAVDGGSEPYEPITLAEPGSREAELEVGG